MDVTFHLRSNRSAGSVARNRRDTGAGNATGIAAPDRRNG